MKKWTYDEMLAAYKATGGPNPHHGEIDDLLEALKLRDNDKAIEKLISKGWYAANAGEIIPKMRAQLRSMRTNLDPQCEEMLRFAKEYEKGLWSTIDFITGMRRLSARSELRIPDLFLRDPWTPIAEARVEDIRSICAECANGAEIMMTSSTSTVSPVVWLHPDSYGGPFNQRCPAGPIYTTLVLGEAYPLEDVQKRVREKR